MPARVLVIALDAADKDLITRWAVSGRLPTFRRLEAIALRGTVQNPFGLYVGALWPSFYTGLSAARHGRYSYTQLVPGTYRIRAMKRGDVRGVPFWTALSRAGRRVAIVDVPKAPPADEPVNGVQIVDWGLHETEVDGGLWTSPRSLARAIRRRYGADPVGCCDLIGGRPAEYESLRRRLIARIGIKTRMIRDLLRESRWDLVVAAFADTHCAGHQLWHLHAQADRPESLDDDGPDALRDVYGATDEAVGDLLREAGPDTVCVVLASHGIGPQRGGNKILDAILRRIDTPDAVASPAIERRAADALQRLWKRGVPVAVKRALITVRQRTWHRMESALLARECADRRYFAVPNNDVYGGIRLNLIGREPHGLVRADQIDELCAGLACELTQAIDLDTGRPAVARVVRSDDHYVRSPADGLPDLFVVWNGDHPVVRVRTARGQVVEGAYPNYRTGDHREDGAFWAVGRGIAPGVLECPVSNTDFAPTIGELLDVAIPGLDGRPVPGLTGRVPVT